MRELVPVEASYHQAQAPPRSLGANSIGFNSSQVTPWNCFATADALETTRALKSGVDALPSLNLRSICEAQTARFPDTYSMPSQALLYGISGSCSKPLASRSRR